MYVCMLWMIVQIDEPCMLHAREKDKQAAMSTLKLKSGGTAVLHKIVAIEPSQGVNLWVFI